jgi:membrane protein YdbS with pleckstrin-like domain
LIIEKLILSGVSDWITLILKHLTQTGIMVFATYYVISKNWSATHTVFVILMMCVHLMKMHSYFVTNRDFRLQAQEAKKKG